MLRAVSYSVLFRQFPLDQLDTLVPLVRQVYGITDFDARAKIRRGWGFLERNASAEEAQRVARAIPNCIAVDNEQLRQLAEPRPVTGLEFTKTGIVPEGGNEIAWDDVAIVAAGGLAEEVVRRETAGKDAGVGKMMMGLGVFLMTGMPVGLLGGKKQEAKPAKSNRSLTFGSLVTRHGEQFAIAVDHFNFSGLGEKKQLQAIVNFRVLITELQQRTSARVNYGARIVLGGQSLSLANYTSLADYEAELLWMFNTMP